MQKAQLSLLPVEVLALVMDWLPQKSLFALALCSSKFYHLVVPRLYCSVYFGKDNLSNIEREWREFRLRKHFVSWRKTSRKNMWLDPEHLSQISNLHFFRRSIANSPLLRPYIVSLSLEWCSDATPLVELEVAVILKLLGPSLRSLYLAPATYEIMSSSYESLVSLAIRYRDLDWEEYEPGVDYLYSLFTIPTLLHLSIEDFRSWDRFQPVKSTTGKSRSSNVTSLSFPKTISDGNDLAKLLTWPRALKSFYIELAVDEEWDGPVLAVDEEWYGPMTQRLSPRRLIEALLPQKDYLRKIHITGREDNNNIDDTVDDRLRKFSSLRRLNIQIEFVFIAQQMRVFLDLYLGQRPQKIWELLPPGLEELQLEIPKDFRWVEKILPNGRPCLYETGQELANEICEIAQHKKTCYPSLQEVMVMQWRGQQTLVDYPTDDVFNGCNLISAFEESKTRLSFVIQD